jgi:hypothetical protein
MNVDAEVELVAGRAVNGTGLNSVSSLLGSRSVCQPAGMFVGFGSSVLR